MRLVRGALVLAVLAVCAAAKMAAPEVRAAEAPVTASFTEVGAHTFTVPTGVTSLHIVAAGAPGGDRGTMKGGRGAIATADLSVTAGQVLGVFVGGAGGSGEEGGNPGGFNGGGGGGDLPGRLAGGGGGGASDVRVGGLDALAGRLVIAAGGGGAGRLTAGADAGQSATSSSPSCGGGGAATSSSGGKGGTAQPPGFENNPSPGAPGELGVGGASAKGGGGGGGLFGGGGGGGVYQGGNVESDGCGGGGGSSGFGAGTSLTSVSTSESRTPSVTITYTPSSGSGSGAAPTNPTNPTAPGNGAGGGSSKATLSLPAVQHGKQVVGTVRIPAARSALKVRLLWQKPRGSNGRRTLFAAQAVVGSLTEAPLKKGLHSFTVKLNKRGKKSLARFGKLKLTLEVRITPPQGAVAVGAKKLTLKP